MRSAETVPQALAAAVELLRGEQIDEAEAALREVLQRSLDQPDALYFLGVLRHTQVRTDEAVGLIRRALAAVPGHLSAWNNPSTTLIKQGRVLDGLMAHGKAVVLWPNDTRSRQEVVRTRCCSTSANAPHAFLAKCLDCDPGNPVAEHMLAAYRLDNGAAVSKRASDRYVQQVVDGFAGSFDRKLEALEQRAPGRWQGCSIWLWGRLGGCRRGRCRLWSWPVRPASARTWRYPLGRFSTLQEIGHGRRETT